MKVSDDEISNHSSGFLTLLGRPNVGKSTLVNKLVGQKIAITSPVAQTTRNRLRAILTSTNSQIILIDTPGIHKPHHLLGQRLVKSARRSIGDVDMILLIFDASSPPGRGDEYIVNLLKDQNKPVIVVLNKIDLINYSLQKIRSEEYALLIKDSPWLIIKSSAINGDGCNKIIEESIKLMPIGPRLYPEDMVCDQPEKVLIGELIREQILHKTIEEVPHSVAVRVENINEKEIKRQNKNSFLTIISATILVERKSQKGILIGKGGKMLKEIGTDARAQIKKLFNSSVHLELFVKVMPKWRSKSNDLTELGYRGD